MKLLIMNYSMDEDSLLFSHQREVARRLSESFEKTYVITADEVLGSKLHGICVSTTRWKPKKRIINVIRFYRKVLPFIVQNRRNLVVFSYMTEVQSFLISPLCRFLGVPHFLWYAHISKSFFLYALYPFINGIITSTSGSCPLKGSKVFPIGQAIDENNFRSDFSPIQSPPLRWYHVGRIDPSKKIDLIISVFKRFRSEGWDLKLDLYGAPSSQKTNDYFQSLLKTYDNEINSNWLSFKGPAKKEQLMKIANEHDGFVHAFEGSLDKAVLEAVLSKRIIASINPEFISEFSIQIQAEKNTENLLYVQISTILLKSPVDLKNEIEKNYSQIKSNHTLDRWVIKLNKVLKNAKQ